MRTILVEVSPLLNGVPTTLRLSGSASSAATTQLNGYQWLPCITKRHSRSANWAKDGVLSTIDTSWGSIEFWLNKDFNNEGWTAYEWSGAQARIFVGEEGNAFTSYTQVFEGNVSSLDRTGNKATVALLGSESNLTVPILNQSYGGTGGADGMVSMKGTLKPRAFGNCKTVAPVLVDGARYVYQVHGYGAVTSIPYVYEYAQALDSAKFKGDAATYADLAAFTLQPAEWATCLAQGMFRLGGAPRQKISADVVVGSTDVASIARQMFAIAGIPNAKIGSLSQFGGVKWSLYLTDQAEVLETLKGMFFEAGGYIYADGTGTWQVGDYYAPQASIVLNEDRSTFPLVKSIKELSANGPVYKVNVGYDRCWDVHSESDVSPALSAISDAQIAASAEAAAARQAADQAASDAAVAKSRLDAIVSDGILDRSEKAQLVQTFSSEAAQQNGLQTQPTNVTVTTERSNLATAFANWKNYLEGLSPAYTDTTQNTPVDRATFDARASAYWLAKQTLLNALAGKASTTATWGGVTGPGTPENYATVGAPAGTNVAGQDAASLVADTANAKGNAQTAINALKDTDGSIVTAQALKAADATLTNNVASARSEAAAAKAEGSTARQEAAQVRTDLVPTITQAQTDANAAKGDAATARSDLATEVSRAKGAEGAITTSVANLKTTVDGHTTTISDNYTTLTNKDTALANRSALLESVSSGGGSLNANSSFGVWPDGQTLPTKWLYWEAPAGWSLTRVASNRPTSQYAARIYAPAGADCGIAQWWNDASVQVPMNPGWYVMEADVSLESGTWNGSGISIQGQYNYNFATQPDVTGLTSATQTGNRRFSTIVQVTSSGLVNWHPMNNWSGMSPQLDAKTLTWYRAAVRPASDAEIKAQKADVSLNTPGTGVIARLGTEETTRTNADSALATRATNLETTVNHGTTGVAATYAKISTEETTRSNADIALANRATNLESTVNDSAKGNAALQSRIGTEETTRATAVSTLANRSSFLESKVASNGAINSNPTFALYTNPTGTPDGWNVDNQAPGAFRIAGETGGNALQVTSTAGGNAYAAQSMRQVEAGTWWVLEADIKLMAGTLAGAGVLFRATDDFTINFSNDITTSDGIVGDGVMGRYYNYRKLIKVNSFSNGPNLYYMNHWGALGSIAAANSIQWFRCAVRPASDAEIKAQKADSALNTPGTGVIARLGTEEATRSNADTALATRATNLETTVNNGTTGVAATYSKITTEETTRSNADIALSNRASSLESTVNSGTTGVAATYSKISAEETTRSNADIALANRATSLEARATGGGNLIANTDFVSSAANVVADGWTPVQAISTAPTFGINVAGDYWHPSNENAISIYQPGQAGVANYTGWQSPRFAVQPGTYLNAYCYMASHRCQTELILYWTDAAGTVINASSSGMAGGAGVEGNGGQDLSAWRQQGFTAVQVPTNALGAVFELRKYNTNAGQADSYAWFVRPFATTTRAGTTEFVPFSPGSAKPSATATLARISNEETTRSNADTALSNRANTLESQFRGETGSAVLTRISNEETTRANADTALATRTSVVEASSNGITTSSASNDKFANWPNPNSYPTGWITWNAEGNYRTERWAASMGSPYSIRTLNDAANVESGFYQVVNVHAGKWVVEVTAQCVGNELSGAGMTLHGQYSLDFVADPDTNGLTGNQGDRIRTWVKMFDLSQDFINSIDGKVNFHAMVGWTGFGRTRAPKYVQWYRMTLRPAGPGDLAGLKNAADIVATNSRISTEEITRANADSALANRTSVVEAQVSSDNNNMVRNGIFNAPGWVERGAGGVPPRWAPWAQDNGAFIGASPRDSRYGAPAPLQIDRNGINNGITQGVNNVAPGWYAFEVDITGEDGNWSGSGVHCNFNNGYAFNFGFAINADTAGRSGDIGTANRQFTWLFYNGAQSNNASLYLMSGWSGFQGATNFGFFRGVWHRIVMRPATRGEILAQKVEDSNLIARVTTTESTIANAGGLAASWAIEAQTPGASAYITARAVTTNGVKVSNVSIGGTSINLVNVEGGVTKQALSLEGGKATFYGALRAGASITLGSGSGWPVALASKDFNVSNGEYVSFGTTLDSLPNMTFNGNGLVALNNGETYRLYAENLTRDGFTAKMEISTPAQPTNYDLQSGQYSGSGLRIIDKSPRADSTNNTYNVTVTGYINAYAVRTDYGENCIWTEAYTHTGKKGYELETGDMLMVLEDNGVTYAPGAIEEIAFAREDTVLLRSISGIELIVSKQTPVTLRDGSVIKVTNVQGEDLAVLDHGDFRWEEIVAVEEAGIRPVARIYVGDKTFAAGNVPDRFIFTHNLPVNKQ